MINDMQKLPDKELTDQIISAAIQVHKTLGPGFIESAYEEALCIEFDFLKIPYERQKTVTVKYRERPIIQHRLDIFVDNRVVVENKSIHKIEQIHFAIVSSYMKAVNASSGLLLNFGSMPLTIKRVYRESIDFTLSNNTPADF